MPYIILRMTDNTETLINEATKNTATEFKVGCSYVSFYNVRNNTRCVAFTIVKITPKYIYFRMCSAVESVFNHFLYINFLQDFKNTQRQHYNKKTINSNYGTIEASKCYEFNDINTILDLLNSWNEDNTYNLTNPILHNFYEGLLTIELI